MFGRKKFKLKGEPKRSWAITRLSTSHYLTRDIYPNLGRDIVGKYSADEKNPERKQISGLLQQLQPSVAFKSQDSHPTLWSLVTLISASKLFSDLPHLDHDGSALHVTRQRLSKLVHRLHSESVPGRVAAADHHCCHHHHYHHLCYLFSTRPYSICSILNAPESPWILTYPQCWVRLDDLCIDHLLFVLIISVSAHSNRETGTAMYYIITKATINWLTFEILLKRLKTQSTLSQTLMTMGPQLDYWLRQPSGVKVNKMLLMMMMMAMMMVMIYILWWSVCLSACHEKSSLPPWSHL